MEASQETNLMMDTVRRFVETEMFPHEDEIDRLGHVPEEIGRTIEAKSKELGLYACNLPEEVGGGGLGYGPCLLLRGIWENQPRTSKLGSSSHRITDGMRGRSTRAISTTSVRGEKRELFALTEPDAGSDVMGMKSNARRDGDDWILNGSKHFVSGPCADFAIVFGYW